MAYKLIKEWRSPNGLEHEITVYKYNISHDEMIRYFKNPEGISIKLFSTLTETREIFLEAN